MIKYCDNSEHIVQLWSEAFGDSREEIEFFISEVSNAKCLMCYIDGEPASMMHLVDCVVNGEKLSYIYAACTADKYKRKGLMTSLIEYCMSSGIKVCLIPANDSLIDYYSKRGIDKKIEINSIVFEQSEDILEYLFDGYNLSEPTALRS